MTESTTPAIKSASDYTTEEMTALLQTGARIIGRPTIRAAVHLLSFTELPGRADFAAHVEIAIENVPPPGDVFGRGEDVAAAFVTDWDALATGPGISRRSGSVARLLALAASLAGGSPVDLSQNLGSLGHAHARRVIEAFAIATGADELYAVTPTPKLGEVLAANEALIAGGQA